MFGLFVYVVFYFHTFLDNVTIQGNKEDLLIHDRNQKTTHPSLSTHNLIFKIKYLLYYGFFLQRCPLPLIFVKPEGFFFAIVVGFFFVSCRLLVFRILYFSTCQTSGDFADHSITLQWQKDYYRVINHLLSFYRSINFHLLEWHLAKQRKPTHQSRPLVSKKQSFFSVEWK